MKRLVLPIVILLAVPVLALGGGETWKNVALVDTMCSAKVKADPDAHTTACAIGCEKGGYGIIAADGTFLKFDEAGNAKALAALKGTRKKDHLRAEVTGERNGDTITVTSVKLD
jgi:hypothetical protein